MRGELDRSIMDGASRFRVRLMHMSCVKKLLAQMDAKLRKEEGMSRVRVLIGTRKGAFVLTSNAMRERWDISGPLFAGWEIYHLKGSPADPNRLYASQSSGRFGQRIQAFR